MISLIIGIVLVWILLAFLSRWARAEVGPKSTEDEIHFVSTQDGWRLALHRYRPRGESAHKEPVFLHHGLASNHFAFDVGKGSTDAPIPSLARWLAECGYDVWACELRGRPDSDLPRRTQNQRFNWAVDDYIYKDHPALVNYILSHSNYQQLHWIGHSMGGILLLAHCALYGSPKIASGVTIGSSINYAGTGAGFGPLVPFKFLMRYLPQVPLGFFSALIAPFTGRSFNALEAFTYWPGNISNKAAKAVHASFAEFISGMELYQLASTYTPEGLSTLDGSIRFASLLPQVQTPILLMAGDKDQQCPPQAAEKSFQLLNHPRHQFKVFGKNQGNPSHYGHFDLLLGLRADQEVFPSILAWLQANPAQANGVQEKNIDPTLEVQEVKR